MSSKMVADQLAACERVANGKMRLHSRAAAQTPDKPVPEVFWAMEDFNQYSDAIWWCLLDIIQRDIALIGKYGDRYDRRILGKLSMTDEIVRSFRRYGMIKSNQAAGPVFQKIHELLEQYN